MNRSLKLNYRVSEPEDRIIRSKAKQADCTVSEYIRKAALQKEIVVIKGIKELLPELHAIGNNLNQQTVILRQNNGYAPQFVETLNSFCCLIGLISQRVKGDNS